VDVIGLGVIIADDDLRRRVDRAFHWPMIVLAVLCVPLIAIDIAIIDQRPDVRGTWLWWVTIVGLGVTWLAFVVEFAVKIAIAECRMEYVRRNWIDLVIIALPALRPLRVAAIGRTARVFSLRGAAMRCARFVFTILVGLDATERMIRRLGVARRDRRADPRTMTRRELIEEVRRLRHETRRWREWVEAHDRFLAERGVELHAPPPAPADPGDTRIAAREDRPCPAQPDDR
jgi:voltage-gated potassium channel